MTVHNLIFIHGMGEGKSTEAYNQLRDNIKLNVNDPKKFNQDFKTVYVEWQTITYKAEKKIFNSAFPSITPDFTPSAFSVFQPIQAARWFMTFYVGDIIAYTADPENKNGIRERVWNQIKEHCAAGPYSILAHSLGSIIAFDYLFKLFERQTLFFPENGNQDNMNLIKLCKENFRNLFTFGSPLGLFMLRQGSLWKSNNPFSVIKNPVLPGCTWLNFYDNQDVAAYPLKQLFAKNPANLSLPLEDVSVQTGDLIVDSHTHYWHNKQMAQRIADVLSK